MPLKVKKYETTPNPNAIKCVLEDRVIEAGGAPRSYRDAASARGDPLASALFALEPAGTVTNLLLAEDWITVNKAPDADWARVKAGVERVLAEHT